jgi:hypothetical protein
MPQYALLNNVYNDDPPIIDSTRITSASLSIRYGKFSVIIVVMIAFMGIYVRCENLKGS